MATVIDDDKIDDGMNMFHRRCPFRWPWWSAGAIRRASPNAACPGLLRKPLDASIGRLLALYCPSGRQGDRQTNNNQQIHLKSWPFRWPRRCAGTIPRTSPDRGGPGLHLKPLDATIRRALAPININRTYLRRFFLSFFIVNSYKNRGCTGVFSR